MPYRRLIGPLLTLGLLATTIVGALCIETPTSTRLTAAQSASAPVSGADERQARAVCGGCHAFPPPDILPRAAWRDEFVRMMFIRENRLPPIGPPGKGYSTIQLPADMEQVLPFYTRGAPERLAAPEAWPSAAASPVSFTRRSLSVADMPQTPAVSHVQLVDFDGDSRLDILGTDMRQGVVFVARSADSAATLSVIGSIPHPARVTLGDIDRDGVRDLFVADLGEFLPADHSKGAVILMRGLANRKFGAFWLDGWPRVADVQSADFNADGKDDLAVAAFGWRRSGRLSILENRSVSPSRPDFTEHVIDKRAGSMQAIPVDLNRDGRMDFVTLLAQEHEQVLAYVNKGPNDFTFEANVIYTAPHPNWGSSGIQLVDLDKDADLDIILTHGDTFDDGIVKPYHGIQWLENTGGYPFTSHTLADLPGVHAARAADVDGDGDLDVVACALLAAGSDVDESTLPALVWLEQTRPGTFKRHTIELGFPRHATLDLGDLDGDGDIDIVVGNFFLNEKQTTPWVDVWMNTLRRP